MLRLTIQILVLLLADEVRIPSRLSVLPEARLKVIHDVVGGPQRVASIQLAAPPLLRNTWLVRDEVGWLGGTGPLSDGDVLSVDLSFTGTIPMMVGVLLSWSRSRSRSWSWGGLWSVVVSLRLLRVLASLSSHISEPRRK